MRIEKFLQNTNPEPEEPLGTINDNKGIGQHSLTTPTIMLNQIRFRIFFKELDAGSFRNLVGHVLYKNLIKPHVLIVSTGLNHNAVLVQPSGPTRTCDFIKFSKIQISWNLRQPEISLVLFKSQNQTTLVQNSKLVLGLEIGHPKAKIKNKN